MAPALEFPSLQEWLNPTPYDRTIRLIEDEKSKVEKRIQDCDEIEKNLIRDYDAAVRAYNAHKDAELRKQLLNELKITKKRQLALPKYRDECVVMKSRIESMIRSLRQEKMIPDNIANDYENINETVQGLLGTDFFDFASRHEISDAEAEQYIFGPNPGGGESASTSTRGGKRGKGNAG